MTKFVIDINKPSILWKNICDTMRHPESMLKKDFWKFCEKNNGIIFLDFKLFSVYIFPGW